MSKYIIEKSSLKGEMICPSSKSQTMRAILFASLAKGKSTINSYLNSPDTHFMIKACQLLGVKIDVYPDKLEIEGVDGKICGSEDVIYSGNSGIILRFISAIAALGTKNIVITGDYSIRHNRPMQPLLHGLRQLGVTAISSREDDYAPIIIKGPIKPKRTEIIGEDSQYVSPLLIACSFAKGPSEIIVKNPGEKPWVSLTLDWLDRLKIPYKNNSFEKYNLQGNANYNGFKYTVPGDFSSAAFPIAAALVSQSELTIKNIDMKDPQGDKELINIFIKMGAEIDIDEKNKVVHVRKGKILKGITVDINNFIDAITILTVVACFAKGETFITNASIARKKECDRIHNIVVELQKMGADIKELEDGLIVRGSALKPANVFSYHDHRMAMSLAVAGMGVEGTTVVDDVACVDKTFPTFIKDFNNLKVKIRETE
jgi:3-phosphoshikimate 1-carboxyvinyltransferase